MARQTEQVAYNFFKCFLEKRKVEIDYKKDLPKLLDYAKEKGLFTTPEELFTVEKWREFGDCLVTEVIQKDKKAERFVQPWQAIFNSFEAYWTEKKIAAIASIRLDSKKTSCCRTNCTSWYVCFWRK